MYKLTGKYRIRKTFFGWKIKVEYTKSVYPYSKAWRKAKIEDLIELGINAA